MLLRAETNVLKFYNCHLRQNRQSNKLNLASIEVAVDNDLPVAMNWTIILHRAPAHSEKPLLLIAKICLLLHVIELYTRDLQWIIAEEYLAKAR